MVVKKIAIFPIQSPSLAPEDIQFAKAFSLLLHFTFESTPKLYSHLVKLISTDGLLVPEYIYKDYPIESLLEQYQDNETDYVLFFKIIKKSDTHLMTYFLYKGKEKELIEERNFILNERNFNKTYESMIKGLLDKTELPFSYGAYNLLADRHVFQALKEIILNDDSFFMDANGAQYIQDLMALYFKFKDPALLRYFIRKLILLDHVLILMQSIQKLKDNDPKNGYLLLLLSSTLIEFKLYDKAIEFLDTIQPKSIFYKLKSPVINRIKAEAYLKINALEEAKSCILEAMKQKAFMADNYALFLEIMYRTKHFLVFKSYLTNKDYAYLTQSKEVAYWAAKYYTEIENQYASVLMYAEPFKLKERLIEFYLTALYKQALDKNRWEDFHVYLDLLKESETLQKSDTLKKVFLFIDMYSTFLNKKSEESKKIENHLTPIESIFSQVENREKNIYTFISTNPDLDFDTVKELLLLYLGEERMNKKVLSKEMHYYVHALLYQGNAIFFIKKCLKIKKRKHYFDYLALLYLNSGQYFKAKWVLKKRRKYFGMDVFYRYHLIRLLVLNKKYKKAYRFLKNGAFSESIFDFLKVEVFFYLEDYETSLKLLEANKEFSNHAKMNYIYGTLLLNKEERKGLSYLQRSYDLKPDKNLHKQLIKEYKRYGIDYS